MEIIITYHEKCQQVMKIKCKRKSSFRQERARNFLSKLVCIHWSENKIFLQLV